MRKPTVLHHHLNRYGESGSIPDRGSRVYIQNDYWWYATREGVHVGPFDSRSEAESGVRDFVDYITHAREHDSQSFASYAS